MEEQRTIDSLHLIERQYAALREAIQQLQEVSILSFDKSQIKECRSRALDLLDTYIAFENEHMNRNGYQLALMHAIAHRSLRDQFSAVIGGANGGNVSCANISALLNKALKHHDSNHDYIFGCFLIDKYVFQAFEDGAGI